MTRTILVERDVEVPMRDGVILRADIYRPSAAERLPVLLERTPYGKGFSEPGFALMAAERGYVVVVQDTRGRWSSEGDGYPFVHEKEDGYDTVQWAAQQEWCDGQVGMYGVSYVGYTQWAAAAERPPALKTMIPAVTFCKPYDFVYEGGAFMLGASVSWGLMAGGSMALQRQEMSAEAREQWMLRFIQAVDGMTYRSTFNTLPLDQMPVIGKDGLVTYFADLLSHPRYDHFWKKIDCPYEAMSMPIFHLGSWYDIFLGTTLKDYVRIHSQGASPRQKLVVGPWTHANFDNLVGEVDFGVQASWMFVLPEEEQLRWFDYWLKGEENGILQEPPVRLFVMGRNYWRNEHEWPLARTKYIPYYLHSAGGANSLHGDGGLSPEPPGEENTDSLIYDPREPVPTHGGGLCCWDAALKSGAYDQREIEQRQDVLVYTTPPLERDLEVTGPLQVNLWAASSALDTDFTAKLVDVHPDGFARNLADGILRASCRNSLSLPELLEPGEVYPLVIDLAATSNVFLAGHRIRLEISSSNYPRFARNPNTGQSHGEASELATARQTIYHDHLHPSHILLPVIEAAG